jgi:hypothetical protein
MASRSHLDAQPLPHPELQGAPAAPAPNDAFTASSPGAQGCLGQQQGAPAAAGRSRLSPSASPGQVTAARCAYPATGMIYSARPQCTAPPTPMAHNPSSQRATGPGLAPPWCTHAASRAMTACPARARCLADHSSFLRQSTARHATQHASSRHTSLQHFSLHPPCLPQQQGNSHRSIRYLTQQQQQQQLLLLH